MHNASLNWTDEQLPTLHTAYNTLGLVRQTRLTMTIWAGGHQLLLPHETLIAHVNIPLDALSDPIGVNESSEMIKEVPIVAENLGIGTAFVKIAFREK